MAGEIQVTVDFQNKKYTFDSGAKAFIFHAAIDNEFHENYGENKLMAFVSFVYECYIADVGPTPLCRLADYIAENWDEVQNKSRSDILSEFYCSL